MLITHGDHPRLVCLARVFQCLAVPRQPLKLLETLESGVPEKAGVGGSTASLATIIPKHLAEIRQPQNGKITHG
jgi:hypothetical protein